MRRTVFYPDRPGRNYITVRGFTMRHAATPWAPPTAEQVGLIGTHWSKGWIIESNTVSHSACSGISLGKHGDAFDTLIVGNRICRTNRGLWLDWMAQGTRVSRNLFYGNDGEDVFVEVNHGPFLFDNNLFLSEVSLWDWSEGGAYAHNLFLGKIWSRPELKRETPYHPAHSTAVAGLATITGGDNRFFNNLFVGEGAAGPVKAGDQTDKGFGLWVYDKRAYPLFTGGNVYCNGAKPYARERDHVVQPKGIIGVDIAEEGQNVFAALTGGEAAQNPAARLVTTETLGTATTPGLPYVDHAGASIRIDGDYFGNRREANHPAAGPFERSGEGVQRLKVW